MPSDYGPKGDFFAESIMMSNTDVIVRVDSSDHPLGPVDKVDAHRGAGVLHRAFTAVLINENNQLLVSQRSAQKPLWPHWWDLACSSHPWYPDETAVAAAARRLPFELGIDPSKVTPLRDILTYEYHAVYSPEWSENEVNHIVIGNYHGPLHPNPSEVQATRWLSQDDLSAELAQKNHRFAPWVEVVWQDLIHFLD